MKIRFEDGIEFEIEEAQKERMYLFYYYGRKAKVTVFEDDEVIEVLKLNELFNE